MKRDIAYAMGAGEIATLAGAGYAVASLNYRLSGEAPFPAAVQHVMAAVRFLRANAARFGLDPGRFGAFGASAGGHLACMLGLHDQVRRPGPRERGRVWTLPPFHLEAGDRDCCVPGERTGQLAAALEAVGADVTHHVVEGAGHARDFPAAARMPGVVGFLDRVLRA